MRTATTTLGPTHGLRIDPGQDVLLALRQGVAQLGLDNALILGGFGSVTSYRYHVVSSSELPPENTFLQGKEPLDIVDMTGMVMAGRVHAHISFCGQGPAFGGHLEEGCQVLTFCMIWLAELPGVAVADWDGVPGVHV